DVSGASLSLTINGGQSYTRNGDVVVCTIDVTYPATSDTLVAAIGGLPFTSSTSSNMSGALCISFTGVSTLQRGGVAPNGKVIRLYTNSTNITNASMTGGRLQGIITYLAGE
ncbi:TPA: hypothetical protein ACP2MH_004523, partial [Escherichia coli]